MKKKSKDSNFVIDVKIHYHGKIFNLSLGRTLRWIIPAILVVYRLIARAKEAAP